MATPAVFSTLPLRLRAAPANDADDDAFAILDHTAPAGGGAPPAGTHWVRQRIAAADPSGTPPERRSLDDLVEGVTYYLHHYLNIHMAHSWADALKYVFDDFPFEWLDVTPVATRAAMLQSFRAAPGLERAQTLLELVRAATAPDQMRRWTPPQFAASSAASAPGSAWDAGLSLPHFFAYVVTQLFCVNVALYACTERPAPPGGAPPLPPGTLDRTLNPLILSLVPGDAPYYARTLFFELSADGRLALRTCAAHGTGGKYGAAAMHQEALFLDLLLRGNHQHPAFPPVDTILMRSSHYQQTHLFVLGKDAYSFNHFARHDHWLADKSNLVAYEPVPAAPSPAVYGRTGLRQVQSFIGTQLRVLARLDSFAGTPDTFPFGAIALADFVDDSGYSIAALINLISSHIADSSVLDALLIGWIAWYVLGAVLRRDRQAAVAAGTGPHLWTHVLDAYGAGAVPADTIGDGAAALTPLPNKTAVLNNYLIYYARWLRAWGRLLNDGLCRGLSPMEMTNEDVMRNCLEWIARPDLPRELVTLWHDEFVFTGAFNSITAPAHFALLQLAESGNSRLNVVAGSYARDPALFYVYPKCLLSCLYAGDRIVLDHARVYHLVSVEDGVTHPLVSPAMHELVKSIILDHLISGTDAAPEPLWTRFIDMWGTLLAASA